MSTQNVAVFFYCEGRWQKERDARARKASLEVTAEEDTESLENPVVGEAAAYQQTPRREKPTA